MTNFVEDQVKSAYDSAFERGKGYVSDLEPVDLIRYRNRMNSHLKHRIEKEAVYV
jgi:hypothetical protein